MHIELVKKPKSAVFIKGSIPADEFDEYIKQATARYTAEAELPGFRKGKAPERMVVEKLGEGALLEEAASKALGNAYPKILKEHNLDAIGRPQVRITKLARGNPLEFEADIALLPEITLPDYKSIAKGQNAKPKEVTQVTDEELTKTLNWLRESRKKQEDENGALPELTDEFAASVGAFKTVEELTNAIRSNLAYEKEAKAADTRRIELMNAIAEKSALEMPDVLVVSEKEKMCAELRSGIEQIGMEWGKYLEHIKKTEDQLKTEWQAEAEKRARSALVLREIAKKESIEPSVDELNTWTYNYLASRDEQEKKDIDLERLRDYAYGIIRNKKVFAYLETIS